MWCLLSLVITLFVQSCRAPPPTVVFEKEPKDGVIPWHGQMELDCKVNYSQATYSWLAVRYAPVDLKYKYGKLEPLKPGHELTQPEVGVTQTLWSHPHSDGRLTLSYPGYHGDSSMQNTSQLQQTRLWLEGAYRCKAIIPGHGSLLSRLAQVRLTDLFLEPGLATPSGLMLPERRSNVEDGPPSLGGGFFWPGEVVVLRCPIKAITSQRPIYRWFFQSTMGTLMQRIDDQTVPIDDHNRFQTTPLDHGQWLEVRLGQVQPTNQLSHLRLPQTGPSTFPSARHRPHSGWSHLLCRIVLRHKEQPFHFIQGDCGHEIADSMARAGFGEYFCKVHIPSTWAGAGLPERGQLNLTGPYIRVQLATKPSILTLSSSELDPYLIWSITPNMTALVDLPPPPTVELTTTTFGSMDPTLWRTAGASVSLPCAVNARRSGSSAHFGFIPHATKRATQRTNSAYELRWTKDGQLIDGPFASQSKRFNSIASGSLHIQHSQPSDSGLYQCRVVHTLTKRVLSSAQIHLLIGQPPTLTITSSIAADGRIQTEKNMSCTFSGKPTLQIEWRKNTEPVQNSHYFRIRQLALHRPEMARIADEEQSYQTNLSIRSLLPNDAGYFQCFAQNRFGSTQSSITLSVIRRGSGESSLAAPQSPRVVSLTETQAYLTWIAPPTISPELTADVGYQVRITPPHTAHSIIMNTTKPALLLADLQPNSQYDVEISALHLKHGSRSAEVAALRFRTKRMIHRPRAVTELTTDSGHFRTLNISWLAAPVQEDVSAEAVVSHYLITLFNLNPPKNGKIATRPKPVQLRVAANTATGSRYAHVVKDLSPDAFYQVSVQAVTMGNVTGYPAVVSSSARVSSRPPSASPNQVRVQSIGAQVATVSWDPPAAASQNGEIILYRINISCDDWLRPRHINVLTGTSQLFRRLTSSTKYELTVAAATRGGNGPESTFVTFTTMDETNEADRDAVKEDGGYFISGDDITGPAMDSGAHLPIRDERPSSTLRPVENLRFIADERSLLLLWSDPVRIKSSQTNPSSEFVSMADKIRVPEIDHYLIKWGRLYPGPDMRKIPANQTRFLIDQLDTDVSYHVDVSVVYKNAEVASAMLTGRTAQARHRQRLLIPLNVHVSSVGPSWAILVWDEPNCDQQGGPSDTPKPTACPERELVQAYQVAYETLTEDDKSPAGDPTGVDQSGEHFWDMMNDRVSPGMTLVNVNRTWARLDVLRPGERYSAMVRAVGTKRGNSWSNNKAVTDPLIYSDWSLSEFFKTPMQKPETAPNDIRLHGIASNEASAKLQVSWQPPQQPSGARLDGYRLYFTDNQTLPLNQWSELRLPANGLNTVLSGLRRGSIYFLQLCAHNRHGDGPLSAVRLFRTPDAVGQGSGEIPLERTYYDARSIPSEFLISGTSAGLISGGNGGMNKGDDKNEDGAIPTSWLLIGFVTAIVTVLITICCVLIVWRRRSQPFISVASHKKGIDSTTIERSMRKPKRNTDTFSAEQDVALLVSNGEALVASDAQLKSSGFHPGYSGPELTTSVTLSAGAYPINMATATRGIMLQSQTQNMNTSSWDRDSDSVQFVSVSQHRQDDGGPLDPTRNHTPTQTASASSNSCAGSIGTPTRMAANPTYQVHSLGVPMDGNVQSYSSATLGATPAGGQLIMPHSPLNQNPGSMAVPMNAYNNPLLMQYYQQIGAHQAAHTVNLTTSGPLERRPVAQGQFIQPYSNQAVYPGGLVYSMENNLIATHGYAPLSPPFMGPMHTNANTPRVNAAELLSFTSCDDIRPMMSSSVHTEGPNSIQTSTVGSMGICQPALNNEKVSSRNPVTAPHTSPAHAVVVRSGTPPVNGLTRTPKRRPPASARYDSQQPDLLKPSNGPDSAVLTGGHQQVINGSSKNGETLQKTNGDGREIDSQTTGFSAEELTQEMANLEGLMKDLSAITREDFNCQ